MVPIALAQKALELRNNPDDAAMWLLENKNNYKDLLNSLFKGPVTKDIYKNQQIDFNSLFEVHESNNEVDKLSQYCTLSSYTGNETMKIGQIVFIHINSLGRPHKNILATFLYQQQRYNYFSTILQNQSSIICIHDSLLKRDISLLKDNYGYNISNINDVLCYIISISNAMNKIVNREILIHLMKLNPTVYHIEDPYLFLQYYKRLSNSYSLDTKVATTMINGNNKNNNENITELPFEESFNIYNNLLLTNNNEMQQSEVEEALKEAVVLA